MKRFYKRSLSLLLTLLFALGAFSLFSCKEKDETDYVSADENTVAIFPSEEVLALTDRSTLADYLVAMREKGLISYEMEYGMINSVNGIVNEYTGTNSMNSWMIYTSDPDQSNAAFGKLKYEGKTYASASLGAESLIVKAEYAYFLAYHSVSW